MQTAAEQLVKDRLLLRADLPAIIRFSERAWDWVAELPVPNGSNVARIYGNE